jgi:hypothetical protein
MRILELPIAIEIVITITIIENATFGPPLAPHGILDENLGLIVSLIRESCISDYVGGAWRSRNAAQ